MDKEQLIAFLKENLKLELSHERGSYSCGSEDSVSVKATLILAGEVISEVTNDFDVKTY